VSSRAGQKLKPWTEAEDALVKAFYPDNGPEFMAVILPDRTYDAVTQRAAGKRIRKTHQYRSEVSRRTFLETCEALGVAPGQAPRSIGSTHRKGRYILVKIAQPDVWKPLHTHVWEQENGPVPEGMIVAAKDGNTRNAVLENLCLRTFAENQLRRNKHYKDLPEQIVDILHLQNELRKTIKKRVNHEK